MGGKSFSEGENDKRFPFLCITPDHFIFELHRVGTSEKPGVAGLGTPHLLEEEMEDEVGVKLVKQEPLGDQATACLPTILPS